MSLPLNAAGNIKTGLSYSDVQVSHYDTMRSIIETHLVLEKQFFQKELFILNHMFLSVLV